MCLNPFPQIKGPYWGTCRQYFNHCDFIWIRTCLSHSIEEYNCFIGSSILCTHMK
ncbi:hypothetical protein NC653_040297 [Populus alba x Populus x berolinensis]|uniref:Uncharacterized protein n=1 Tax=Populus alba x Populus x berolinensis TaxID=444605 RepID=A0AAD6PSF0_9ROSI|nr:hypothetical protein NC653_040297 [Populus alba x Populus x berolinensis]